MKHDYKSSKDQELQNKECKCRGKYLRTQLIVLMDMNEFQESWDIFFSKWRNAHAASSESFSQSNLGISESGVKLLLYYAKYLLTCWDTVKNNLQEHRIKQKIETVAIWPQPSWLLVSQGLGHRSVNYYVSKGIGDQKGGKKTISLKFRQNTHCLLVYELFLLGIQINDEMLELHWQKKIA